jgi:hypothetical protein
MQRRDFLSASLAASAVSLSERAAAQSQGTAEGPRDYFLIRRYHAVTGPQQGLIEKYFADALIPTLKTLDIGPAGAMRVEFGPETPTYYLLLPSRSLDPLVTLDLRLAGNSDFVKSAEAFWSAPAAAPAFVRVDSTLLISFDGWPMLVPPAAQGLKGKRIFQLRTYESPSFAAHVRKVEMFNSGEFEIFKNAGCRPMFFADTLVGARMPSLTYMLSFAGLQELEAGWDAFRNDPAWKKLSGSPRYNYEAIVSNITNLTLSPLECSQI